MFRVYRWDFRYYSHRLPHTMDLPEGYDLRALAAEYFGAVTWMDGVVGRLLNAVAAAGLQEDTLFSHHESPRVLADVPETLFDNARDPFQYDNLATAQSDHPMMAELRRRDALIPWSSPENDHQ